MKPLIFLLFSGGQLWLGGLQEGHRSQVLLPQPEGHRGHRGLERGQLKVFGDGQRFGGTTKICRQCRTIFAET